MLLALAGNQNCGKTTLFNALTGANQHVGNFPGVTVECKTGQIKSRPDITLADLPGTYSLRPYTTEEIITRDFLTEEKPDGIINIVDAVNIERNLYLTVQLLDLGIPAVIALSMTDVLQNSGGSVDTKKMSEILGVPVIPVCASKNEGLLELTEAASRQAEKRVKPSPVFTEAEINTARALFGGDINASLADMRYSFIEELCAGCVVKPKESKAHKRSLKADRLLTGRYTAIPIFLLVLFSMFFLTFDILGGSLSGALSAGMETLSAAAESALLAAGINPVIRSLITDGIFSGVGGVLSFLPIIVALFFFLSVLEDTGYMARVAFIMDAPMRRLGLSGKSFVPVLLGFGCTVPAVMASRTVSSERDRKMTVLLLPFMSCSAKIPVYTVFASAFFSGYEPLVITILYLTGVMTGIAAAAVLKRTVFRGEPVPFIMELPDYRLPSLKSVGLLMLEKSKDFIKKAFTVIFVSSVAVWFLRTFNMRLDIARCGAESILALFGRLLAPLFVPLGLGDWRIVTALISGISAKEAVVSTLSVLFGVGASELPGSIAAHFSLPSAVGFLVFTLLYTPCIAGVSAMKREFGSAKYAASAIAAQCAVAWAAAFIAKSAVVLSGL